MRKIIILVLMLLALANYSIAQSNRDFVKEDIRDKNTCRTMAITRNNGIIALYGRNGNARAGIPTNMANKISELNEAGRFIDDVQITEGGSWLILHGKNGVAWAGLPYLLESKIKQYNNDDETINSITFNDNGDWIIISNDYFDCSNDDLSIWIAEGMEKYGKIWAAHLTNDGLIVCYQNGYKFYGEVPWRLKEALSNEREIDVYRIKFTAQGDYFFADKNGNFRAYF